MISEYNEKQLEEIKNVVKEMSEMMIRNLEGNNMYKKQMKMNEKM